MLNTRKFATFLTLPEAAALWENIPLQLLANAAYPKPCLPVLPGYPDLTARAEALIEAVEAGTLKPQGSEVYNPHSCETQHINIPLEECRFTRKDVQAWIDTHWPDSYGTRAAAEQPAPTPGTLPANDRLIPHEEARQILGLSRATFDRRRAAGRVPQPAAAHPNRWRLSEIMALVSGENL